MHSTIHGLVSSIDFARASITNFDAGARKFERRRIVHDYGEQRPRAGVTVLVRRVSVRFGDGNRGRGHVGTRHQRTASIGDRDATVCIRVVRSFGRRAVVGRPLE